MKSNKKRIARISILAVVLIAVICAGVLFARPIKITGGEVWIEELSSNLDLAGWKRVYAGTQSKTTYINDNCGFTSSDYKDYCKVDISVKLKNKMPLEVYLGCVNPAKDNDFIILSEKNLVSMSAEKNSEGWCSSTFICLRNGMTDEEIAEKLSKMKFEIRFGYMYDKDEAMKLTGKLPELKLN